MVERVVVLVDVAVDVAVLVAVDEGLVVPVVLFIGPPPAVGEGGLAINKRKCYCDGSLRRFLYHPRCTTPIYMMQCQIFYL